MGLKKSMASKEELYVSLSPITYRAGKYSVLKSKSSLLLSLKVLRNLKILAKQKKELKIKLKRLVGQTIKEIDSLKEKLPESKLPKDLQEKKTKHEVKIPKQKKERAPKDLKKDYLDEELKSINEKLKDLNTYI